MNPLQQTTPTTTVPADTQVSEDDPEEHTVETPELDPTFGIDCTSTAECGTGLVCSGLAIGATVCTTPCVGSGKGGHDDCPSGYACYNFESTTLDGVQICLADWQLGATTPGYPFTTRARGACTASDNSCQTGVCNTATSSCVAMCLADRDCDSGEVCYAYTADNGYLHVCWKSDLATYRGTGQACSEHDDCDSGVCANGLCANHCRSAADCAAGTACDYYAMNGSSAYVPVCLTWTTSTAALGTSCTSDSLCGSAWCVRGACTTPCATADDCDATMAGTDCIQVNLGTGSAIAFSAGFCL